MSNRKWIGILAAGAVMAMAAGCHNNPNAANPPIIHGETFAPEAETRAVMNVTSAQAATGAHRDASLYAVHFDSSGLNSLGRQKLDLILADDEPADPLVVYLDLPATAAIGKDRDSVLAYLKDRGLPESQVSLRDGTNSTSTISAAEASTGLHAMQSAPQGSAATGGGSPPAAPGSNAGTGYLSH